MKRTIVGDLIVIEFATRKKCAIPRDSCLNCRYVERIFMTEGNYYIDCAIHENCNGKRCRDFDEEENNNN